MKACNFYQQNPEEYDMLYSILYAAKNGDLSVEDDVNDYLIEVCEMYNLNHDDLSEYALAIYESI